MKTHSRLATPPASSFPFLVLLACLALLALACGGPSDPASESDGSEPTAVSDPGEDAVEYEPAYPEDVSTDGLSESDAAQQHGRSHDDDEPMHDDDHDGEHSHGDDGDHPHGDDSSH